MASSYLLSLREGIEAALLIGIVLGGLSKLNRTHLSPVVARGNWCSSGQLHHRIGT